MCQINYVVIYILENIYFTHILGISNVYCNSSLKPAIFMPSSLLQVLIVWTTFTFSIQMCAQFQWPLHVWKSCSHNCHPNTRAVRDNRFRSRGYMSTGWHSLPGEVWGHPAPHGGWCLVAFQVLQLPQAVASHESLQAFKVVGVWGFWGVCFHFSTVVT